MHFWTGSRILRLEHCNLVSKFSSRNWPIWVLKSKNFMLVSDLKEFFKKCTGKSYTQRTVFSRDWGFCWKTSFSRLSFFSAFLWKVFFRSEMSGKLWIFWDPYGSISVKNFARSRDICTFLTWKYEIRITRLNNINIFFLIFRRIPFFLYENALAICNFKNICTLMSALGSHLCSSLELVEPEKPEGGRGVRTFFCITINNITNQSALIYTPDKLNRIEEGVIISDDIWIRPSVQDRLFKSFLWSLRSGEHHLVRGCRRNSWLYR